MNMPSSRLEKRQCLEVTSLCLAVAIAWGLVTMPLVIYNLPTTTVQDSEEEDTNCSLLVWSSGSCGSGGAASGLFSGNDSSGDLSSCSPESGGDSSLRNCSTIRCSEGFYCTVDATSNVSVCRPHCETWRQYSDTTQAAIDAVVIIGGVIGLTAGTIALIITVIRWKKLLKFPSVLSVYLNISLMVFALVHLVSFVNRPSPYCSSTDLQESLNNPTFFCTITGILVPYIGLQTTTFWLIHVIALFYIITFPLLVQSLQKSKRCTYFHITTVLVALVLPAVLVTIIATNGSYTFGTIPPFFCLSEDTDTYFYPIVLPFTFLSLIGTTLLLVQFYLIHKHYGLFHARQSKNSFTFSTAERKILFSFFYFIIVSVTTNISIALLTSNMDNFRQELKKYFACEEKGFDPENTCERTYLDFTFPAMFAITAALFELFPVANLVYIVDFSEVKKLLVSHVSSSSSQKLHQSTIKVAISQV